MLKNEQYFSNLQDNIKYLNNHANGVRKAERVEAEAEKDTFEEIIVEKYEPKYLRNSLNAKQGKYKEKHTKARHKELIKKQCQRENLKTVQRAITSQQQQCKPVNKGTTYLK